MDDKPSRTVRLCSHRGDSGITFRIYDEAARVLHETAPREDYWDALEAAQRWCLDNDYIEE